MATYQCCPESVNEMADAIIAKHEPAIKDNGVKIDFLFASAELDDNGVPVSPAIKVHGVSAAGVCKIIGLKDRAKGQGDVEIILDKDHWDKIDEAEQAALLHHELYHIVPTTKRDDLGRPKIKMRPHDYQIGHFFKIARIYKSASMEIKQMRQFVDAAGQTYFPEWFGENGVLLKQPTRISQLETRTQATV